MINYFIGKNYSTYSYKELYVSGGPLPLAMNVNTNKASLIPVATLKMPAWIPFEDMFYTLQFNEYDSREPYAHMAENCPGQNPFYQKPPYC